MVKNVQDSKEQMANQQAVQPVMDVKTQPNPIEQVRSTAPQSVALSTLPWNKISIIVCSLLFGVGTGYLLTWQNLKRMGRENEAQVFLIKGGLLFLGLMLLVIFFTQSLDSSESLIRGLSRGISFIFPFFFAYRHLQQWEKKHTHQTKFSFSILLWSFLGFVLTIVVSIVSTIVATILLGNY